MIEKNNVTNMEGIFFTNSVMDSTAEEERFKMIVSKLSEIEVSRRIVASAVLGKNKTSTVKSYR